MKKSYMLSAIFVLFFIFACSKQDVVEMPDATQEQKESQGDVVPPPVYEGGFLKSFGATITQPVESSSDGDDETKTIVDGIKGTITWQTNDKVIVTNGDASAYAYYIYDGKKFVAEGIGISESDRYVAFFPASYVNENKPVYKDGTTVGFNISYPSEQIGLSGSLKDVPMLAQTTSGTAFSFSTCCSVLKFHIRGYEKAVSKLIFTLTDNNVCGAGTASVTDGGVKSSSLNTASGTDNVITVDFDTTKGGSGNNALNVYGTTTFYVFLPSIDLSNSFSVALYEGTENFWTQIAQESSSSRQLVINTIQTMRPFGTIFSGGVGESNGKQPFLISNADDFKNIQTYINKATGRSLTYFLSAKYQQTDNIDFGSDAVYPIGSAVNKFVGKYIGNNKSLSNFTINQPDNAAVGLWSYIDTGAEITNLNVNNSSVKGQDNIGAIAGRACRGAKITSCKVTGVNLYATTEGNDNVGGIVGGCTGAIISSCEVSGNSLIFGGYNGGSDVYRGHSVGGIAGHVWNNEGGTPYTSEIISCASTGITVKGKYLVGGIAGRISGRATINKCYSDAYVSATDTRPSYGDSEVGGIVGGIESEQVVIINCVYGGTGTNSDTLSKLETSIGSGSNNITMGCGGIVGYISSSGSPKILNCFAKPYWINNAVSGWTGKILGAGGIVGRNGSSNTYIVNCYSPIVLDNFKKYGAGLDTATLDADYRIGSIYGQTVGGITVAYVYGHGSITGFDSTTAGNNDMLLFGEVPDSATGTDNPFKNVSGEFTDKCMKGNSTQYAFSETYSRTATNTHSLGAWLGNTTTRSTNYSGAYYIDNNMGLVGVSASYWLGNSNLGGYWVPNDAAIPTS